MQERFQDWAPTDLRVEYVKMLKAFLNKEDLQIEKLGEDEDFKLLNATLNQAIDNINPSIKKEDEFFNNIQLAALFALEAEFFKCVTEIEKDKNLLQALYKKLYVDNSKFTEKQEKLKPYTMNINYTVSMEDICVNPLGSQYDAQLYFQKKFSILMERTQIIVLKCDDLKALVKFLSKIDPRILAHFIAKLIPLLKINMEKRNILHEAIIAVKTIANTIVNIGMLFLPSAAIASGLVLAGVSLPITIGIGLLTLGFCFESAQIFDQGSLHGIMNETRRNIDNAINNNVNENQSIIPKQTYSPMQLFDVKSILSAIANYIISCYKKNKVKFQSVGLKKEVSSIEDLISNAYIKYMIYNNQREEIDDDQLKAVRTYIESIFDINDGKKKSSNKANEWKI
jgi:hypothetical protein